MIPPRCSAFPCLFRHDCSRAFVARDGRAGRDDERGDGRRQARARGRDRRRSRRPDGGRGPGRPGHSVDVYDAMPSVGRKFLMAGRGGLNLTHSEPAGPFLARYGDRAAQVAPWLARMDAAALRDWAHGLGVRTFVGTSGRVFPEEMKAALLRAWLAGAPARPALSHAAPLARLARGCGGRRRGSAFRYARGRASRLGRCRRAGRAAAAGPASVRMAPGRRACARVALPWRRCGRPIAGSTWTGRNISASATRASRSSRVHALRR